MVQNMTKGKTTLKGRKLSLLSIVFMVTIVLVISLFVESYFLALKGMEIFFFGYGIWFFIVIHFYREEISVFWSLLLISAGILIGSVLNISLSTEFLAEPSVILLLVGVFNLCILLWGSFTLRKDISWVEKSKFVFMGCSIISLVFAFLGFRRIIMDWLSLLPLQIVLPSGQMRIKADVIVNILKSLFLSSLFNVMERITRIPKKG